jgi:ribose/xylose/arabinose/galactoside ABC-type transport system permease subunit
LELHRFSATNRSTNAFAQGQVITRGVNESNGMNMIGVDPYLQNIAKGTVLIAAVFLTIDRKKIGIVK